MMWLLELLIIWLSIDIIICATYWYLIKTIKPVYPGWWKRNIVFEVASYFDLEPDLQISEPGLEPLHRFQP